MLFKDVVGQEEIKNKLLKTVKESRISHAQMFFGNQGAGKLALAIAYAQYISCTSPTDSDSCGKCPSCNKYQKLIHPDLHFVFPVVKSPSFSKAISDNYIKEWRESIIDNPYLDLGAWLAKIGAENKQGSIYVDESAEILRKLNLKTFESEYKVMIIWIPEKMHVSASNKLLKILEEPPPKTVFLLVSENTTQMLPTILSRVQLIKVPKLKPEDIFASIKEKFSFDDKKTRSIVRLSDGDYFKATELCQQEGETVNFEKFTEWMRMCYKNDVIGIIAWVDNMATLGRESQKGFLAYSLRMIRENLMLTVGNEQLSYLSESETGFAKNFHPFINEENIFTLYEELNKASFHIEANAYDKLVFLDMSLKFMKLIKGNS